MAYDLKSYLAAVSDVIGAWTGKPVLTTEEVATATSMLARGIHPSICAEKLDDLRILAAGQPVRVHVKYDGSEPTGPATHWPLADPGNWA